MQVGLLLQSSCLLGTVLYAFSLDNLDKSESINESQYVVYNPSCQISNYQPFHEEVKRFYEKLSAPYCSRLPRLTSVSRPGRRSSQYILKLHKEHFPLYREGNSEPRCCYSVLNVSSDGMYSRGDCMEFNANTPLDTTAEVAIVTCKVKAKIVYENLHFFVINKSDVQHKAKQHNDKIHSNGRMSVMIVGIDSVSRLNLLRTMPLTYEYLVNNSWYALRGYHKIHANTFYNLNGPVLTGYSIDQLRNIYWPKEKGPYGLNLDSCPWIWRNFSARHYITAYGEDAPKVDSFALNGRFKTQQTDYYMRPFMLAGEKIFKISANFPICIGPTMSANYILDYSLDFAIRFMDQPTFSLFWTNTFSHNLLNGPSMVDIKIVSYFRILERSGVLNRSMIVFMSDHGFQVGKYRQTYMGSVEDSLPFLFLWVPKWFEKRYPSKVRNLIKNRNKLTSHYDLHLTLMDVLGTKTTAAGCPTCVSLFDSVPWNRSCADAGISKGACACAQYEPMSAEDPTIKQMAVLAITHINNQSSAFANDLQNGTKCSTLTIRAIKTARRRMFHNLIHWSSSKFRQAFNSLLTLFGNQKQYVIHIDAQPGNALFEATVLHDVSYEVTSISRLDRYNNKSRCMMNRLGKMYCNCELAVSEKHREINKNSVH